MFVLCSIPVVDDGPNSCSDQNTQASLMQQVELNNPENTCLCSKNVPATA